MSRKHYQAIADILRAASVTPGLDPRTVEHIATQLGLFMLTDNPNFSMDRFLHAVGVRCEVGCVD